ncbi:MAG: hypothetical protein JO359_04470 [Candidatus Eremiobacteraeota bacterium]|nr:hypothetical protein [Candidatus Eremiobacteraeota bacterium]
MIIRTAIALIATAIIIKAGAAFAQVPPAPPAPPAAAAPAHPHQGMKALLRDLNLSPDQTAKIDAIRAKYRTMNENVTDPQQRRMNRQAQMNEIKSVLTPDQQAKLQAKIQAMRQHRRQENGTNQKS